MHRGVTITMYTEDNTENIMTGIVHRVRLLDGLPSFQANVYLQVHVHCFTPPPPQSLRVCVTGVVCTSSYISERVLLESVLLGIVPASVYSALEQKQLMP